MQAHNTGRTTNAKAMKQPSFLTEVTSEEEGVSVGMDSIQLADARSDDKEANGEEVNAPEDETVDGENARNAAKAKSNSDESSDTKVSSSQPEPKKSVDTTTTSHDDDTPNNTHESKGYYLTPPLIKANGLSFLQTLREYRHTPCLMTPLTTFVLLAILISSLVSLLFTIPQFVLGIFLGPFLRRQFWLVEFLYRWDVVGWGHVKLMETINKRNGGGNMKGGKSNDVGSNRGSTAATTHMAKNPKKKLQSLGLLGHSDTLHQRTEVVPGKVYIHPIPQFVDNLCYLIVCLPNNEELNPAAGRLPIIGALIDVGEAKRTLAYLECIYEQFYEQKYPRCNYYMNSGEEVGNVQTAGMGIEIHAILSTHRHHDHTAGIGELVACLEQARCRLSKNVFVTIGSGEHCSKPYDKCNNSPGRVIVVGAAVESVPHCNLFVKNECFIPLPCVTIHDKNGNKSAVNDMNSLLSIECIGVPSHTRGSMVYALRNRPAPGHVQIPSTHHEAPLQCHLFTGDAIFSGGGGVPFEADLEYSSDNFVRNPNKLKNKNGNSSFRPGAGVLSMERCFTEVLTRATKAINTENEKASTSSTLLYPGHEYTTDLLMRQFDPKTTTSEGHWTRMAPSVFFETASYYLVSAHKRALPQGQKLISLPCPLDKEIVVNPNFRSLKRKGEHVVNALRLWYDFGSKGQIPRAQVPNNLSTTNKYTISSPFRTIYAKDLDTIVEELRTGAITASYAADRIELLQFRVNEKLIGRRPIPNHLPSNKGVYLGIVALAVLGSPPTAMTLSDALLMDLAAPADSTDLILISKSRLIAALSSLGLLSPDEPIPTDEIINLLWEEARPDDELSLQIEHTNARDIEATPCHKKEDLIELGMLKLALFGVSLNQPSWFTKYCLPCWNPKPSYCETSWTSTSKMKRTTGEMVKHDVEKCAVCQNAVEERSHTVYI